MKIKPILLIELIFFLVCAPMGFGTEIIIKGRDTHLLSNLELQNHYERICLRLGIVDTFSDPVTIIFSDGSRDYGASRLPEWGGGGVLDKNTILIVSGVHPFLGPDLARTVIHELVHIAIIRASRKIHIPRWFHEGCAMMYSGEVSFEEQMRLARAVFTGGLMKLYEIESVNAFSRERAFVAYSVSHAALRFLVSSWGAETPSLLLAATCSTGSFLEGLDEVLGLSETELEHHVRSHITKRYGIMFLVGDFLFVWLFILILAVVAFFVAFHKKRNRLKKMEEQEKMDEEMREE